MTSPLVVRLATATEDTVVTGDVSDVEITWAIPGGAVEATIFLSRPVTDDPSLINPSGTLHITDGRSAEPIFQGRLADPGRSITGWEVRADGPAKFARDRELPLIYADRVIPSLRRVAMNVSKNGATDEVREDPGGTTEDVLVMQFPQGLTLATGDKITMRYRDLFESGQKLARVDYNDDSGRSTNYVIRARTSVDGLTSFTTIRTNTVSTAGHGSDPKEISTNWAPGANVVDWEFEYTGGGGAVADDTAWASLRGPTVLGTRWTAAGVEQLTGAAYPLGSVYAHEIVADLIGRLMPLLDGANASIATNTFAIAQLAYKDGTTAERVLEDLMRLESKYYWAAWTINPATGKYTVEWRAWPTTVRYEMTPGDDFDEPGGDVELVNRVNVRWRDITGRTRMTVRTSTVPALAAAGVTVERILDLGDDVASTTAAAQAGDVYLAEHSTTGNTGALTVRRPIWDLQLGRMVEPFEIRPGNLIRLHGVTASADSVTATGFDGAAVFPIWANTYRMSSNSAELDLQRDPRTLSSLLARLAKKAEARRR